MVIFGNSRCAYWLVKEAIAVWLPEHPLTITLIAPQASRLEARLRQECPGLFVGKRDIPQFIDCTDLCELDLTGAVNTRMADYLWTGNYFVVAGEDDLLNLEFAITLRSTILSQSTDFSSTPFIAVRCTSGLIAQQTHMLAIGTERLGYQWFNNYDLKYFGTKEKSYSFDSMENSLVEQRARMIHCSYNEVSYGKEDSYEAMGDYFRRHYNRDSSRITALSLPYRAFAAGVTLPQWELYGYRETEVELASQYDEWLAGDPHRLEEAAQLEHERWNCFMLSRGWQPASTAQAEAYIRQGNLRQQLYAAKLHPYICEWKDLPLIYTKLRYYLIKLAERKLSDPCEVERFSVKRTSQFLKSDIKKEEDYV